MTTWPNRMAGNLNIGQKEVSLIYEFQNIQTITAEYYSGDLKSDHLKSGLFKGRISNGLVFK